MKKIINLKSDLLNRSAIARKLNLTQQNYSDKLNGRGKSKQFTNQELTRISNIVKNDLFNPSIEDEKIPLKNIEI